MSGFWPALFLVGLCLAAVVYILALKLGRMAIVDLIWTLGMGLGAIAFMLYNQLSSPRAALVLCLVLFWSLRLSFYLFKDRVRRGEEDPRYQNLAVYWGEHARRNFLGLFLIQVPFVALFLLPLTLAMQNLVALQWTDILALVIAVVALLGEALADRQLAGFRADPDTEGQVCRRGLWRYSRHPNYFFEWLHWWAYVAFAVGSANWWLSLVGPLGMYIFLRYLTGVPHAERSSLKRRGDAYRRYQQTTSPFFPWIPRQPQR